MARTISSEISWIALDNSLDNDIWLRIEKRADCYRFLASQGGKDWITVGPGYQAKLHCIRAGVGAMAPGSGRDAIARFDFLSGGYPLRSRSCIVRG